MPTIKQLREEKGWSQQELATRASVSIHTIGKMEAGQGVLKSTLVLVCQALGVKPGEVTGISVVNRVSRGG